MFPAARKPVVSLPVTKKEVVETWTGGRFGKRTWFLRSDRHFAGPTGWDAWKPWKSVSAVLRPRARPPPPGLVITPRWRITDPVRLTGSVKDCADILEFWRKDYGWNELRPAGLDEPWVRRRLRSDACVALGIRTPEGELCATAFSVPVDGEVLVQNEQVKHEVRILECVVVNAELRGKGLASWLFAWLDHITSSASKGSVLHIAEDWTTRRRRPPPSLTTPATSNRILSLRRDRLPRAAEGSLIEVPGTAARNVLDLIHAEKKAGWDFYTVCKSCSDLKWYRSRVADFPSCSLLTGIKMLEAPKGWDAWKRGTTTGVTVPKRPELIGIVTFCCIVRTRPGSVEDMYDPFWDEESTERVKACFEQLARNLDCDRLLVSDTETRGCVSAMGWKDPWTTEPGVLWSAYLYNMMTPGLGRSSTCWIR